ncbi:MAG: hypothetical protein ABJD67_08465 [Qipengyuania citrea]|uniref:hypothetical protein n=1 Tax=Qipengyuania citrea TaxID=225971 RepID=UPI003263C6AB
MTIDTAENAFSEETAIGKLPRKGAIFNQRTPGRARGNARCIGWDCSLVWRGLVIRLEGVGLRCRNDDRVCQQIAGVGTIVFWRIGLLGHHGVWCRDKRKSRGAQ